MKNVWKNLFDGLGKRTETTSESIEKESIEKEGTEKESTGTADLSAAARSVPVAEREAYCSYLTEKAGKYMLRHAPNRVLSLQEVLKLVQDGAEICGQKINEDKVKDFFFRRGYLAYEENKIMYPGEKHLAGKVFFINIKGFGHPNGKPVMTPPKLPVLLEHLPELFLDETAKEAAYEPGRIQLLMEGSRLFFMTFREKQQGSWNCSFDFEKAEDSHYDLEADAAKKLITWLQSTLHSDKTALSVLVHEYLDGLLFQPGKLESAVVKMLNLSRVSYKQFHFY